MGVKASTSITLSAVVDVASVTRYYLLQSSTLSPPAKPTTKPPTGSWNDTEPTYTSGSTNSLYFCDLTVFSDGTWSYSSVSRSSSYEAAKDAYNRAIAAGSTASAAQTAAQQAAANVNVLRNEVSSRGVQLVTNGSGLMGNNTNFTALTYDPTISVNSSNGSFTSTARINVYTNEFIPLSAGLSYLFEFDVKTLNGLSTMYSFLQYYDADKLNILGQNVEYIGGTLTTLTQDLKPGDTVVHLADLSRWKVSSTPTYQRRFMFWGYTNSLGYTYPPETYTRDIAAADLWADSGVDKTANTITLRAPWTGATKPAGTQLSQCAGASWLWYCGLNGQVVPAQWQHIAVNPQMGIQGTAYCKVGFLWNYNSADDQTWVTNVSLKEDFKTPIEEAQRTADSAQEAANTNAREIQRLDNSVSGLSTQFNVFSSGIEATIEDHNEILSAMSFSTEGLKIQMSGSIYYTLTDDTGYHIYQNDKEIAAFSEGKGRMDELQMGRIVCRKTSKGGWVWNGVS